MTDETPYVDSPMGPLRPGSTKYLAGRVMKFGTDEVQPGDTLTKAQVTSIAHLEAFISAGYIYPVSPAKGYDQLPPHVFLAVQRKQEAMDAIRGASGLNMDDFQTTQDKIHGSEDQERARRHADLDEKFAAHRNAQTVSFKSIKDAVDEKDVPDKKPARKPAAEKATPEKAPASKED